MLHFSIIHTVNAVNGSIFGLVMEKKEPRRSFINGLCGALTSVAKPMGEAYQTLADNIANGSSESTRPLLEVINRELNTLHLTPAFDLSGTQIHVMKVADINPIGQATV